jgi:sugar lactone lactonase YvrE
VQICDQPGRVVAIIRAPANQFVTGAVFGGPDMRTLYVTARDKVPKAGCLKKLEGKTTTLSL